MVRSYQEQLDDCDAAIAKCEAAQMYTEKSRTVQRAQLATMYAERQRLMKLVSAPSNMILGLGMPVRPT